MTHSKLKWIVERLGLLIFREQADKSWHLEAGDPDLLPLAEHGARARSPDDCVDELCHFFQSFLAEARRLWANGKECRLDWGPITILDQNDQERHLALSAFAEGSEHVVVIEELGKSFDQLRSTMQKGREAALARELLLTEVDRKEVLMHTIVHDLSALLSSMLGALGLLQRTDLSESQRQILFDSGLRSGRRQEELIREILDVYAFEKSQGEHLIEDSQLAPDIIAVAQNVVATLGPAFALEGVELSLETEPDSASSNWKVAAVESKLERVLTNLLTNALRHSPQGSEVRLSPRHDGDSVIVTVEDSGSGVPEAQINQLFTKFSQGNELPGAAGLGLYFCRVTVESWGGEIGYEPNERNGARFWIRLRRPEKDN